MYDFSSLDPQKVLYNVPVSKHTTFRIGGSATLFLPTEISEIETAINLCKSQNIEYFILGNGSNLLVRDGGYKGLIIKTTGINKIELQENNIKIIKAQAGAKLPTVARFALDNKLTGLEFAWGIPGTLGGAVFMNAGAYDGEMKNIVIDVDVLKDGKYLTLTADEMKFAYRDSVAKHESMVILSASLGLQKGDAESIKAKMDDFLNRRKTKQPLTNPNAGSTFKRPVGYFTGPLIRESGLMGYRIGDAMVSTKHAGFVVNMGNASAKDVRKVIEHIKVTVKEKFNVTLEEELITIGDE